MLRKFKSLLTVLAATGFLFLLLATHSAVAQEQNENTVKADEQLQFDEDSSTATKRVKRVRPDGSEEEVVQTGKVKSKRKGGPRVGEINASDRERIRSRVQSLNFWSVSFGPAKALKLNNDQMFYNIAVTRHWEVNTNAEIRFSSATNIASKDKGSLTSFGLGAAYIPSVEDISPIIGAEFGYGFITGADIESKGAFQLGLRGGLRMFRTASTQMSLEGFYNNVLVSENPGIYGIAIGVLFE